MNEDRNISLFRHIYSSFALAGLVRCHKGAKSTEFAEYLVRTIQKCLLLCPSANIYVVGDIPFTSDAGYQLRNDSMTEKLDELGLRLDTFGFESAETYPLTEDVQRMCYFSITSVCLYIGIFSIYFTHSVLLLCFIACKLIY